MRYTLTFTDVPTGVVADTFKTIAAIIAANTTGHRARIRSLQVGPADDAPADLQCAMRLERTNNATAGTPGSSVTAANIAKKDTGALDCLMTGGRNYSAEPTTFETEAQWQLDFNARGGFVKEWEADMAPKFGPNQTLCVRAAPRTTTAVRISGSIEFELY